MVEGLTKALDALRDVIAMITAAADAATAKASLQGHLDLSERQADAVLAMPLRESSAETCPASASRMICFMVKLHSRRQTIA